MLMCMGLYASFCAALLRVSGVSRQSPETDDARAFEGPEYNVVTIPESGGSPRTEVVDLAGIPVPITVY